VYNLLNRPQTLSATQKELGLITRPHTELYYLDPEQIPRTLWLAGTGLSSVWARKHFPAIKNFFVLAENPNDTIPRIPSNEGVDYKSIKLVNYESVYFDKASGLFAIKDPLTGQMIEDINLLNSFYTAIGYRPYTELTDCVTDEHKLVLDRDFSWTAPKNIPVGSLTQRLMAFYAISELYDDYNCVYEMQYYSNNVTPMQLQQRLRQSNIELGLNFFGDLQEAIQELHDPLEKNQEIDLYMEVFMRQNPSLTEQEEFKNVIRRMQQEINERQELLHAEHKVFAERPTNR
jgi:hypothetical protein